MLFRISTVVHLTTYILLHVSAVSARQLFLRAVYLSMLPAQRESGLTYCAGIINRLLWSVEMTATWGHLIAGNDVTSSLCCLRVTYLVGLGLMLFPYPTSRAF